VRPIVIARDLTKTFPLHHHRVLSLKERVMNAVRGRTGSDEPFVALNHISFEVAEGESVALVGRNGSGKSTLLKMIAGIHHATGGKLLVRSGKRIATMIELGVGFHPDLSGRENVHLNAAIHGLSREQIEEIYPRVVAYAELEPFMDNALKTYSSGMVMRLGFAVSINLDPDLFLLDEIFAVGDEAFQRKCLKSMQDFKARGRTMFFVSHSAEAVRQMCERAIVLEHGLVRFDGDALNGIREYRRVLTMAPLAVDAAPAPLASLAADAEYSLHRRIAGYKWEEAGGRHLEFLREQGLRSSDHLLDVGCGPLRTGVKLLQYLEPNHYVGVDNDASMIEAGVRIEAPLAGVDPSRGQYFIGNATDLAAVEGQFDVIWVNGLVQDLPHEQTALVLASAIRRLALGGRMYVAYFEAPEFLAVDPIERPGPCFSYFDRTPRHFDFATLARYVAAAGGCAERIGEWRDPHGQMMLVATRSAEKHQHGPT
jgi:ABC-type polysaccharide/polyol phosphate transport system ATPase subunit/SAM-dependent methyltransferase